MTERGGWYETHAAEAAARYESVAAEEVNGWLLDFLPEPPACVLDVGAGSGRDTAWLASLGHEVIAVDPSPGMLAQARLRHPGLAVRYLHDGLPELTRTLRTGISFDFVLVNAVWMHVPPADRRRAFRKLVTLLKPGGVIAFTLRHPPDTARGMHPVSGVEIEELARQHGAFVERSSAGTDFLGRTPIRWEQAAVRIPDDGTGALPLLRHVILNDDKSSTYKLALLRALCRIADGAAGWAADAAGGEEDRIIDWWDTAYVRTDDGPLTEQFTLEASATLPTLELPAGGLRGSAAKARMHRVLEDVFAAVSLQRIRLSNDQQIPEWSGPSDRRPRPASRPARPAPVER